MQNGQKRYLYLPCKIEKDETYLYQDASGKAKSSCMKIRSDDTAGANGNAPIGWSTVTALYPRIRNAVPTGYLILDNGIGLATLPFPK